MNQKERPMQPLQNLDVASLLAREHETLLTRPIHHITDRPTSRPVRRWIGRQLVRTGLWLATDLAMRPAAAR
jgi:hypothetical protein